MRNRWLINLVLLVIVVLLGWLAFNEPDDNANISRLTDIDPLNITYMHIEHKNQPVIELEKIGTQWFMQAPYRALANNKHINKLLSVLETPSHLQFDADRDLAQYGLDDPEVNISMNDDLHLSLGDIEPVGKRRYIRVGNTVHVIGDSPFAQLTAAASLLVDTALFAEETSIKTIHLPSIRMEKQQDGGWQVTPATNTSADKLNAFADRWKHARAVFVSDPEKPEAGDQAVTITLADNTTIEFGIVELNTGITLVNRQTGLHYHFAEDVGKQLLEFPRDLTNPDT